jgi:cell division protein FtsQ
MKNNISIGKWKSFLVRLFGFIILGLIILAVDVRKEKPIVEIKTEIKALPDSSFLIEEEDVLVELDRGLGFQVIGQSFKTIDLNRIETLLEKNPFIKDAEVFLDSRNRLGIHIIQRKPIVRVINNRGDQYYLDEEGIKLPLSKHFAVNIITATGEYPPFSPDFLTKDNALHDLYKLCGEIEADPFLKSMLVQIHVTLKENLHWFL